MTRLRLDAAGSTVRYAVAMIGPVGSSGAQFLLSIVLLRVMDQGAFGRFSFLLVASQVSWGVWTALFCAPLPILLTTGDAATRARLVRCLMMANLIGAAVGFVVFLIIGKLLGEPAVTAALFAGYAAVALIRWFGRAHAYATGHQLRTTASDCIYTVVLLAGMAVVTRFPHDALTIVSGVLLAGAVAGLPAFGKAYLKAQFGNLSPGAARGYAAVWRLHSGWSLLGVLTTEATANAHSYLIILLRGPAAFAPIAASALLIRPIMVAMNALTEFERARMAHQIDDRRLDLALRSVAFFRLVLIGAWVMTGIAIVVLLARAPRLIFPRYYDLVFLVTGALLWMLVGGVRLLRTPDSALLQAAGAFRPLAMASVWSSAVSIALVLILLLAAGPLWSIAGILLGEAVFAVLIWRQARRWLATRTRAGPGPARLAGATPLDLVA